MTKSVLGLTLLILAHALTPAQAKNFGRYGEIFPIAEVDMLAWIEQRLQHFENTGRTAQMQRDFVERVEQSVKRPQPVEGLGTTTAPQTYLIDPSLKLGIDIKDAQGNVLYPKGLVINPFDRDTWPIDVPLPPMEYSKVLIFLDGDDPRQIAWAKQYQSEKTIKWILTNGSPDELAERLETRIFFDQQGNYSKAFRLSNVPAEVKQDGKHWRVTEFDVTHYATHSEVTP